MVLLRDFDFNQAIKRGVVFGNEINFKNCVNHEVFYMNAYIQFYDPVSIHCVQ